MERTIDAEREMTVVMQVTQKFQAPPARRPRLDCEMTRLALKAMPCPRRRPQVAERIRLDFIQ